MNFKISKRVIDKIQSFYQNVASKYRHTYDYNDMHRDIDNAISSIYSIEDGLPRRKPTIPQWAKYFMATTKRWNFAYGIDGSTIYVEDACHAQNMKNANKGTTQQSSEFDNSLNDLEIQEGQYFNGLKVGYNKENGKYVILKPDNSPLINKWLDKQPKFLESPYGKYLIIAYVSYNKSLYAIGIDGKMYDMNRLWDDAYLSESFINYIVSETINEFIHNNLITESTTRPIRLKESQLHKLINDIIKKIPPSLHREVMMAEMKAI